MRSLKYRVICDREGESVTFDALDDKSIAIQIQMVMRHAGYLADWHSYLPGRESESRAVS